MVDDPTKNSIVIAPLSAADQIKARILDLQYSLQQNLPNYEAHLHTIHRALANNPDTVHFLTDEQIGIICSGLSKKTDVVISKSEAKKNKNLKGVTINDL